MSSHDRRAIARRRAWGRGPLILRFESLEGRQLMAAGAARARQVLPDVVTTAFVTAHNADWKDAIDARGVIANLGKADVPAGVKAGIYASRSMVIGPGSMLIGVVPITAGLGPGESMTFDQKVTLPASALVGMQGPRLWLGVRIDPEGAVKESNERNNEGRGKGIDQSIVDITAKKPSNLVGTAFSVGTGQAVWGQAIAVTAQVSNNAQGDAPPTRAKVVLTPGGQVPGGAGDVTIGSLDVPAIPAFGRANLVREIRLPVAPPGTLLGQTSYLISMIQDADHEASLAARQPQIQGIGLDTVTVGLTSPTGTTAVVPARPDLAAAAVVAPNTALNWGQNFQVSTSVQNLGKVDAPAFNVRFFLTGANGSLDKSIYLGEAAVKAGLAAEFSQELIQTVELPSRLPFGYNVAALDYGRIVAVIDTENLIDETVETNNSATSAPVTLYLLNSDGTTTVPTQPPIRQNAPIPASTGLKPASTVNDPNAVVPRKRGSYKVVAKPKENPIIHQIKDYPRKFANFFKSLNITSKSR